MHKSKHWMRVLSLTVAMSFLLSFIIVPKALASQPVFDIFDMNDRFATETTGADGFGRVRHTMDGSIQVHMVQAENLLPDHPYELKVTIGPPGPFSPDEVRTFGPVMSNPDGHLLIKHIDLGSIAPGDYRVDLFVTHTHPTVSGSGPVGELLTSVLNRDPLLACQPAPVVTVTEADS